MTENNKLLVLSLFFFGLLFFSQIIYYSASLGFLSYRDNGQLISVPVDIHSIESRSLRVGNENFGVVASYTYEYKGQTYHSDKVASGLLLFKTLAEADAVIDDILRKNTVYISADKPSFSVLINRENYIAYNPKDTSMLITKLFMVFFTIPLVVIVLYQFLKTSFQYECNKFIQKPASLFVRLTSICLDLFLFIFMTQIVFYFICGLNIFYFSKYEASHYSFNLYLIFGWPFLILVFLLLKSKTPGMFLLNLEIVDASTLNRSSKKQILLRFLNYFLMVITAGIPLLINRLGNRQMALNNSSNTVVVQYLSQENKNRQTLKVENNPKLEPLSYSELLFALFMSIICIVVILCFATYFS